jgi:hypothetical protein
MQFRFNFAMGSAMIQLGENFVENQPARTGPDPRRIESTKDTAVGLEAPEAPQSAIVEKLDSGKRRKYARFVIAALSSIPWIGGAIGAAASFSAEKDQERLNELEMLWLKGHEKKIRELSDTLTDIFTRLENFGDEIQERIESPGYLSLVRKCFRSWDAAETDEKKRMLKNLITNAGAIKLCSDDLVRLFINWIDQYHETHFLVIKQIYKNPRATRAQIWDEIYGQRVREDSAEADLFRYLIRDLSVGGVIRQERETDGYGRFMKKESKGTMHESSSRVMESAFENTKPYVLTALGRQFVHYVMEDVVRQISAENPGT